jgi:hypothetical protein
MIAASTGRAAPTACDRKKVLAGAKVARSSCASRPRTVLGRSDEGVQEHTARRPRSAPGESGSRRSAACIAESCPRRTDPCGACHPDASPWCAAEKAGFSAIAPRNVPLRGSPPPSRTSPAPTPTRWPGFRQRRIQRERRLGGFRASGMTALGASRAVHASWSRAHQRDAACGGSITVLRARSPRESLVIARRMTLPVRRFQKYLPRQIRLVRPPAAALRGLSLAPASSDARKSVRAAAPPTIAEHQEKTNLVLDREDVRDGDGRTARTISGKPLSSRPRACSGHAQTGRRSAARFRAARFAHRASRTMARTSSCLCFERGHDETPRARRGSSALLLRSSFREDLLR